MRKLLSANLSRLWINRAFRVSVIFSICIEGVFCLLLLRQGPAPSDLLWRFSLQFISIILSVFFSLFLGTEYSDGTIRNKIISGHTRNHIYLASLLSGIAAITLIYLSGIFIGFLIGILLATPPAATIGQNVLAGLIGWLICISFISIFNLIGMLSSSKSKTAIISILTAFMLLFLGTYSFNRISVSERLSLTERRIHRVLFNVNPSGQSFQILSLNRINSPWILIISSLFLSFILLGFGLYFFRKKDLR